MSDVQNDIAKIRAAIEQLKAGGDALFTDEIAALEKKAQDLEAQAKAEIDNVETEVKTWAEQFRETHGVSVPVAMVVGGYIAWQVITAIGKVLGAI